MCICRLRESASKIEPSSVSRCTYFRHLCHVRGHVRYRTTASGIYTSTIFSLTPMHNFMLDLDMSQYPMLHDFIYSKKFLITFFSFMIHSKVKMKMNFGITFPNKNTSSYAFNIYTGR